MESIRIYKNDVTETLDTGNPDTIFVRRRYDSSAYYLDRAYYERSMADRGFVVVHYEV